MIESNLTVTQDSFRWDDGHLGRALVINRNHPDPGVFELTMRGAGVSSYLIDKEQAVDLFTGLQAWIEQLPTERGGE